MSNYALIQRIARRDKKAFLSHQCKEIEEKNRMGKTRVLFKKIRYHGHISCKERHSTGQQKYGPSKVEGEGNTLCTGLYYN